MRKQLFLLLFIASIILIDGCMVGPNFQKSEPTPLDSYRFDSLEMATNDSALNLMWWELFRDPVLDTLINIGLRENKDVIIAVSRIDQSRTIVGITKADYWPQFGYSVGVVNSNVLAGLPTEDGSATTVYTGFGTLN